MRYPKELWDDVNEELYGHEGNSHEAIVRYCFNLVKKRMNNGDLFPEKAILKEFNLE